MELKAVWNLTDEDRPDVDESEEGNVSKLLKWEHEWENMVWHTLSKPIQRVEGMAGIRSRHDPLVMGLVQCLVNLGMVQTPVDPINAQIGEADKQRELQDVVESEGSIRRGIIKLAIAAHFDEETRGREEGHYGH